jgi:hypothetical protein
MLASDCGVRSSAITQPCATVYRLATQPASMLASPPAALAKYFTSMFPFHAGQSLAVAQIDWKGQQRHLRQRNRLWLTATRNNW